jgi:hypothetical protein
VGRSIPANERLVTLYLLFLLKNGQPVLLHLFLLFIVDLFIASDPPATIDELLPAPYPLELPGVCGPGPRFSFKKRLGHG